MSKVSIPWAASLNPDGGVADLIPAIHVVLFGANDLAIEEPFVIDSGADISMAPKSVADRLGLDWASGRLIELHGVSPKPECSIQARILDIEVLIPEAECSIEIPMCFADSETSCLLGRLGFFDAFRIEFDKSQHRTTLELLL